MFVQIVSDGKSPPRNHIVELTNAEPRRLLLEHAFMLLDKSPGGLWVPFRVFNLDTNVCSGYSSTGLTDKETGPLKGDVLLTLPQFREIMDAAKGSNPVYIIGDRHGAEVYVAKPSGYEDTSISGIDLILKINVEEFRSGAHVWNSGDLWFILNAMFSKRPSIEKNQQTICWSAGDCSKPRVRISTADPTDVNSRMASIVIGEGATSLSAIRRTYDVNPRLMGDIPSDGLRY